MRSLIFLTTLLATSLGQAETIRCTFTEPFVNSQYEQSSGILTYRSADGAVNVIENVTLQEQGQKKMLLVSKDQVVLQELDLTYKGSDGMSDRVYPIEVKDFTGHAGKGPGGAAHGGCLTQK